MKFIEINLNPLEKKTGDCSIRALMKATGDSWDRVYLKLCDIGFDLKTLPNSKETLEKYLEMTGWIRHKMPKKPSGKRYTVKQLAEERGGTMIIQVANHFTTIYKGDLYDTWDCSDKSVYNYYTLKAK